MPNTEPSEQRVPAPVGWPVAARHPGASARRLPLTEAPPSAPGAIGEHEFARLMRRLGPFGAAPRLAVGVSGGADSLATFLLAEYWTRCRGGDALAVVVDHGLRSGSAAEAAGVVRMLRARGSAVQPVTLTLAGGSAVQARAREARHAALHRAATAFGAPWLLLGHHRGDQAETLLFRLLRGSGEGGLAAMEGFRNWGSTVVLRPLLGLPPARLRTTVLAAGLVPVEDPSNADPRFTRVRLRAAIAGRPGAEAALAAAAEGFWVRRERDDRLVAARLAVAAGFRPEGWVELDREALRQDRVAVLTLSRLVRAVGGGIYPPAEKAVMALLERGGGTLGGACWRGAVLFREAAACAPPVPAGLGRWDGCWRFPPRPVGEVGAVGDAVRSGIGAGGHPGAARLSGPAAAIRTMPALWQNGRVVEFPLRDAIFVPNVTLET